VPSGLGCTTVLAPESAALAAAMAISQHDHMVWGRLRSRLLANRDKLRVCVPYARIHTDARVFRRPMRAYRRTTTARLKRCANGMRRATQLACVDIVSSR
jgi:hypothetical protein